jgi:hypothetical protein
MAQVSNARASGTTKRVSTARSKKDDTGTARAEESQGSRAPSAAEAGGKEVNTETLPTNVGYLYRAQTDWEHNPPYQRPGGQWGKKQKQKFIDSLLNNFPVPPIYLHKVGRSGRTVIDGKQRLETIREFINGDFFLADDFTLLDRADRIGSAPRAGESYGDFTSAWKEQLLSYTIPVIEVSFSDDDDAWALVRQIFLRLNSGTKVKQTHIAKVREQLIAGAA